MKINTNTWNKIRYTLYTPVYDWVARLLSNSRKKSIESLEIKAGDKILIIGAGTGLDLEFMPDCCEIVATDITPAMIDKTAKRAKNLNMSVQSFVMDGQSLTFADQSFDKIILHLILAVIPDPVACIKEAERVLKADGQIVVFDKFVRKNQKISVLRRVVNVFSNLLFTDITRDIESIVSHTQLSIVADEDADFNGNFRRIKMEK